MNSLRYAGPPLSVPTHLRGPGGTQWDPLVSQIIVGLLVPRLEAERHRAEDH